MEPIDHRLFLLFLILFPLFCFDLVVSKFLYSSLFILSSISWKNSSYNLRLLGLLPPLQSEVLTRSWPRSEKYRFRTKSIWSTCGPCGEISGWSTPRGSWLLPAEFMGRVRKNCTHLMPFDIPIRGISLFCGLLERDRFVQPYPTQLTHCSPFPLWETSPLLDSSAPCSVALE